MYQHWQGQNGELVLMNPLQYYKMNICHTENGALLTSIKFSIILSVSFLVMMLIVRARGQSFNVFLCMY